MSGYNRKPRYNRGNPRTTTSSGGVSSRGSNNDFPFVPSVSSPMNNGFGNVQPLASNGNAFDSAVVKDGLGRSLADLSSAYSKSQGGNFMDFLSGLVGDGKMSSEIAALIIQAATQYGLTVDQRMYDNQLTQDQRQYDWNLLQDQRLYNNPQNELARLMGAGISRDAALQMLSGSAGGSGIGIGSGSPVVGSSPAVQPLQTPGTQAINIANTAINGVNSFANLVSMGFNMAQSYEQIKMLSNQNALTQGQAQAFDSVGSLFSVLQSLNAPKEAFGSVSDATRFVFDAAKNGNENAIDFVNSGHIRSLNKYAPYASRYFADLYRSERESQDYRKEFQYRCDLMEADKLLKGLSAEQLRSETANLNAKLNEIVASTEYLDKQKALAEAMIRKTEEEKNFIANQSWVAYYQSLLNKQQYETEQNFLETVYDDGKTGRDWLNDSKVQAIIRACRTDAALNADGYSSKLANMITSDAEVAAGANALIMWKQQATAEELNANPQYAAAAAACELLYKPYFDSMSNNKDVGFGSKSILSKIVVKSPTIDTLTDPRDKTNIPKIKLPYKK